MLNLATHNGLVFLDTETTSLDCKTGEIISVCIIEEHTNGKTNKWTTLIKPKLLPGTFSDKALEIAGYDRERWKDAPEFYQVAGEIVKRLTGKPIIGHNVQFDINFIEESLQKAGWKRDRNTSIQLSTYKLGYPKIDTVALAWLLLPCERQNLNVLREHLGIDTSRAHDCVTDTEDCRSVFWACVNETLKNEVK